MHPSFAVAVLFSMSILIAGLIAVFRFGHIKNMYRPFIYLIWIACLNELLSVYLVYNGHYDIINYVIYSLCESLLLLWFFRNLGAFRNRQPWLYSLIVIFIVIWVVESFFGSRFVRLNYYFDVFYSFCVVILAIRAINDLLFTEKELLKNPTFLICMGIIIFFTYEIVEEMFWLYGLKESRIFRQNVQSILMIVNLLCNLIYALAILWMRKRQAFTLQF